MATKRLTVVASLALAGLLSWLLVEPVTGQGARRRPVGVMVQPGGMPGQPGNAPTTAAQYSAIKLVEKSEYRQFINVAQDCIKDKAWNDAATALQNILDQKEDFYVQVKQPDAHGNQSVRWTSVKYEANSLLGSMPSEGLDVYELRFGGKARQMLDEGKRKGDWEHVADVAQRYLHTKAGTEATELLATYFLDRGQFFTAALRFEQLLKMNPERVKISDLTLYKTALACRRAGEVKKAEETWKKLEPRLRDEGGLRINGAVIAIDQLRKVLEDIPRPETADLYDWPLIRGNITNSAQAVGSPPLLDKILWQRPVLLDKSESGEVEKGIEAKEWIDKALTQNRDRGIIPGSFPIAAGRLLVYRSYSDVRAVLLQPEKDTDGKIIGQPGEIAWKTTEFDGSLAQVLADTQRRGPLTNPANGWLTMYERQPGFLGLVYENSLLGTLATDHRLVYAVDDLAVPAPSNIFNQYMWNMPNNGVPNELKALIMGNSLQAFELQTGKIKWKLGGNEDGNDPFGSSHFLGVPLSVGGKLYVLNEKNTGFNGDGELRLVCIDPVKEDPAQKHRPRVISVQSLGMVQQQHRVTHDMSRRVNAVQLAFGEGILVCPTNAGEVLGVDLLSRSLAWAYPYREEVRIQQNVNNNGMMFRPNPYGQMPTVIASNWKSSPPVIQDGMVVFTAPDASSVHCVSLRDGKKKWKSPKSEGDLFLAGVFKGKVLIVGKNSCRILRLNDGAQLRYIALDSVPSGQGVACKNVYYLPLAKGDMVAIDLNRETITAHIHPTKPGPLGNLIFHEGVVMAQSPLEIVAYPQLATQLEMASAALKADAANPEKLFNRGELRLYDGQVQGAVEDLQQTLALKPPAALAQKAKERLYQAMTDLFQVDFNHASKKYLEEYRELCNVPDNARQKQERTAKFLRIVGKGREDQGNLVEAFRMYREFGDLPINREEGVPALDNPTTKVPTSAWLRGRIAGMMARATTEQRAPLEAKIAEEWKVVESKKDLEAIRNFAGMFDVPFKVGREARLRLAEAIMAAKDKNAFLEAELNLEQLRVQPYRHEPGVGGRALAALALLEEKKGTAEAMKLAAAYYRQLGREFPKVAVRDGKTGSDLLNDLATDKRFLPYLEETRAHWGTPIKAKELPAGNYPAGMQGFMFYPRGDLTPAMKNLRIVLDPGNQASPPIRLVDVATNTVRWTQNLPHDASNMNYQFRYVYNQAQVNNMYFPDAHFRFFQVKGHLAMLQVGMMVYALDLDTSRVLWSTSLLKEAMPNNMRINQVQPNAEGDLEMFVFNNFTQQLSKIALGHIGTVQASYVALVTQKGLEVLDPLKGKPIWTKRDVSASTRVFGDEHHIFLVSGGSGVTGAGTVFRASNGEPMDVPDFGFIYQNRLHVQGRDLLATTLTKDGLVLHRYDIVAGKDIWSRTFETKAVRLHTDDPGLAGVIEPSGRMTVVDASIGKDLLQTNVVQFRIKKDDLANLHEPLLLRDRLHYYLALNHPIDHTKVAGGIQNNFNNGLRCALVNGWFAAFYREDGQRKTVRGAMIPYKKGEMHWHLLAPITNQMLVVDQFDSLPVLLFSARYNRFFPGGGGNAQWVTLTQSADRNTGAMIWDPKDGAQNAPSMNPLYSGLTIDPKAGTILMSGFGNALLHYVADGRKTALLVPGGMAPSSGSSPYNLGGVTAPQFGGFGGRVIIRGMPAQVVPVAPAPPAPVRRR